MSGFFLVNQSPPSFDWCSNGLQNDGGTVTQKLLNALVPVGTTPVYISPNGTAPSILNNKRGTWSYSFKKTGKTNGTTTGTTSTSTSFTDTAAPGGGTTNYTLTITDGNTGILFAFKNSVTWGGF
jgi:hypothetical protein